MMMHSLGFALILIGVNYLIMQERILGQSASLVEHYVNEAVWALALCDGSTSSKTIRRSAASMIATW